MQDKYKTQATEQVQLLRTGQVCDAWTQHGGGPTAHPRSSRGSTIASEAFIHAQRKLRRQASAAKASAASHVGCEAIASQRTAAHSSAQQRTAAHSSAQLLWDTIEKTSAPCKMLGTQFLTRSVREMIDFLMSIFGAQFLTRSVREMIDFLMSIFGTQFLTRSVLFGP